MSENISPAKPVANVASIATKDAIDAVSGSLLPRNAIAVASVDFYEAALRGAGKDPESLSFAEAVEVTRKLYALSADYRRAKASDAATEREAAEAEAREKRAVEKRARLAAEKAKLEKRLAALG